MAEVSAYLVIVVLVDGQILCLRLHQIPDQLGSGKGQ